MNERNYTHGTQQGQIQNFNSLLVNDYELLHFTAQLIPLMDRCGRFMSGINFILIFRYFSTSVSSDIKS